jgi:hypothetical protein
MVDSKTGLIIGGGVSIFICFCFIISSIIIAILYINGAFSTEEEEEEEEEEENLLSLINTPPPTPATPAAKTTPPTTTPPTTTPPTTTPPTTTPPTTTPPTTTPSATPATTTPPTTTPPTTTPPTTTPPTTTPPTTTSNISENGKCGPGEGNNKRCPDKHYCNKLGQCGRTLFDINTSEFNGNNPSALLWNGEMYMWVRPNQDSFSTAVAAEPGNNHVCRIKLDYARRIYNVLGRVDQAFRNQCNVEYGGQEYARDSYELLIPLDGVPVWRNKDATTQRVPVGWTNDLEFPNVCRFKVSENPIVWAAGKEIGGHCLVGYGRGARVNGTDYEVLTFVEK